jgi:type I restriction enzyme S subunit
MTEDPYKLPSGWRWVRLGETVHDVFSGGTPSTKKAEYWGGAIPWITSAAITEPFVENGVKFITEAAVKRSTTRIVPAGNLIVATRVGIGKVAINKVDLAINQDLTGLLIDKAISTPEFLFHVFSSSTVQERLITYIRGTTIKGITREKLLALQ